VIGTLAARETTDPVEVITATGPVPGGRTVPTAASVIYVGKGWAKAEVLGRRRRWPAATGCRWTGAGPPTPTWPRCAGDPSDGCPASPGSGEKTAQLITQFGFHWNSADNGAAPASPELPLKMRSAHRARDYLAVAPAVVRIAADAPVG